jgi:FkbM family methyltransferase
MKIRKTIKKYLPDIFTRLFKIVKNIFDARVVRKYQSQKLKNFTTEKVVEVAFGSYAVQILIKPQNGWVDNYIFLDSIHEPEILKIIKDNVKKGDTVVDIGANIGQHTLFMSKFVGSQGFVYGFEPLKTNIDSIYRSIALNNIKNVQIENKAVGEVDKKIKIYVPANKNDRSSRELVGVMSDSQEEVDMITMDTYFKNTEINFLKIDTEGFEPEVLAGAKEIIKTCKPTILFEYAPKFYQHRNIKGVELLNYLISENYILEDIPSDYGKIEDIAEYSTFIVKGGSGISNILATYKK